MNYLGFDLEVSKVDKRGDSFIHKDTKIVEFGMVIWDNDRKIALESQSFIVKERDFKKMEDDMVRCVGLKTEDILNYGVNLGVIHKLMKRAIKVYNIKGIVAHNGFMFDFPLLKSRFEAHDLDTSFLDEVNKIDTLYDLDYDEFCVQKNLTYLAGYYSMRAGNHRALDDTIVMMEVFGKTDKEKIENRANSELIKVFTQVDYDDRFEPKERGFRWDGSKKKWVKIMRMYDLELEVEEYPFDCEYETLDL